MPLRRISLVYALMAVTAPIVAGVMFYVRVLGRYTTGRIVLAVTMALLIGGAYCGVVALRSKGAHIAVRIVALAGAVICVAWAVPLLFATVFGP